MSLEYQLLCKNIGIDIQEFLENLERCHELAWNEVVTMCERLCYNCDLNKNNLGCNEILLKEIIIDLFVYYDIDFI